MAACGHGGDEWRAEDIVAKPRADGQPAAEGGDGEFGVGLGDKLTKGAEQGRLPRLT